MPREMIENERSTAINPAEAVEEKVSLSDRFGLWLGFHNCDQDTYFAIVEGYARRYGLKLPVETLRAEANEWSVNPRRALRPGRLAIHPGPRRPIAAANWIESASALRSSFRRKQAHHA